MRLIDADELKEALKSGCEWCHDANTNWCEHCCKINDFEDLIDNAPTKEYPFYQEAYQTGYEEGKNERPQGKWIKNGADYQCNKCFEWCITNEEHLPAKTNFCPNCGASMKKGGAE